MPGGLAYDDSGTLAAYFSITILTILLLPVTINRIRRAVLGGKKEGRECGCSECRVKVEGLGRARREDGLERRVGRRTILILFGWTLFTALAYYIYQSPSAQVIIYNPFEILGISSSANETAIKKHYKRLSLEFHPDKIRLGPNQTQEEVDAHFVDLTKAYKSLTDDSIRENLVKYGNPDGQQPREEKIAIPQWVVDGQHGMWALGVYGLVLAGGLPWLTGKWWNSQRVTNKDGALNESAELFFRLLREDTSLVQLIALLAGAIEYRTMLSYKGKAKKDRKARTAQTEALHNQVTERAMTMGYGNVLVQASLTTAPSKRAAALLWTQLLRIDDLSPDLLVERRRILGTVTPLFSSLLSMASVPRWLTVSRLIMHTQSRLVQGVPFLDYPIAQLPGVSLQSAVESSKGETSLQTTGWQGQPALKKLELPEEARKVADEIPVITVSGAKFEVEGEDSITPQAQVQFVCEVSVDAISSGGSGSTAKGELETAFAHAPRWPAHRKPQWWILIGDPLNGRIVVPPTKIIDVPTRPAKPNSDAKEGTESKTVKLQFPAPPEKCELPLKVYIVSDTFVGCDKVLSLDLVVVEPEEEEFEDDISDPEEDTIAGALAMAKGQRVKPASSGREADNDDGEEDEDESSGTDGGGGGGNASDSSDSDSD